MIVPSKSQNAGQTAWRASKEGLAVAKLIAAMTMATDENFICPSNESAESLAKINVTPTAVAVYYDISLSYQK